MSKFIVLDKCQYGSNGLVPIRRGDDVSLTGAARAKCCDVTEPFDLSGKSASAYFAGETANLIKAVTVDDAPKGKFHVDLSAAETALLETTEEDSGIGFYVVVEDSGKMTTIESSDSPLEILDREFKSN